MATYQDDIQSALDDPFIAPAIGLTDHISDEDSTIQHSSINASATGNNRDASKLDHESQHSNKSGDDDDAWVDEDDDKNDNDEDDNISLYENFLDGSEKHWEVNQGETQPSQTRNPGP